MRIPEEYTANHLILMLRLKSKKRFLGPLMFLFIKIIKRLDKSIEESAFDLQSDRSDNSQVDKNLRLIQKGIDVYSEQELFNMGSILCDEGYGSFDRCMLVLRVLRGDIERAR